MSENGSTPPPTMPSSGRLIFSLGLIAMMSGLLVVMAFQLTAPRIAMNKQRALEKAIFTVLPQASVRKNYKLDETGLVALPDEAIAEANVFAGYDAEGQLAGLAMEASARGYQDVVTTLYGYSVDSACVIGITVLQSTETPGLGDKVETDPDFLANFECLDASLNEEGTAVANPIVTVKNGEKTEGWQIDGISGATVTSTAIGDGLRKSTMEMLPLLERYKESLNTTLNP
ncbi:MAG: FMN-binding protein [Puniceicoccaceae bacterium]